MKRIIGFVGAVALLGSGSVFADGSGTVAQGATQAVTTSTCTYLASNVNLQVSKNSVGAWDCTGSYIGVAAASVSGQKKIFKGSSAGGKVAASTTECSTTTCGVSEAATVAQLGSSGS